MESIIFYIVLLATLDIHFLIIPLRLNQDQTQQLYYSLLFQKI